MRRVATAVCLPKEEYSAAGKRPGAEERDKERGNTQERAQRKLVTAGDGPADRADLAQAHLAGPLGQGFFPSGGKKKADDGKADDRTEESADEDGEKGAAESEKCANHEHHFHVAETHAITVADDFIEPSRQPEEAAAEDGAKKGVDNTGGPARERDEAMKQHRRNTIHGRNVSGEHEAQADAKPVDDVGKDAFAKVGDDENHQDASEAEPFEGGKRKAKAEIASDKEQRGGEFDGWVHRGNRGVAGTAIAAKQEPADDGHVVVGLDAGGAMGATGARGNDRSALRNPRDADIQEAAGDESEEEKGGNGHTLTVA